MVLLTSTELRLAIHLPLHLSLRFAHHLARRWLAACAAGMAMGGAAHAQAPALPTSVFDSYRPYTEEPLVNWKAANDTTARIGGWREYARQAQELSSKPSNTPTLPTTPTAKSGDASVKPLKKAKP